MPNVQGLNKASTTADLSARSDSVSGAVIKRSPIERLVTIMPEFEGKWKPTDFFFVVSQFEINAEGVWLISAQRLGVGN
jgi:hypothetical protein